MIAVGDLDAARRRYEQLGFEVRVGGEHDAIGTANLIVPFDDERYIELIGVRDAALARERLPEGVRFVELVDAFEEIPMIFVLRTDPLPDIRTRLAAAGIAT